MAVVTGAVVAYISLLLLPLHEDNEEAAVCFLAGAMVPNYTSISRDSMSNDSMSNELLQRKSRVVAVCTGETRRMQNRTSRRIPTANAVVEKARCWIVSLEVCPRLQVDPSVYTSIVASPTR